MAAHMNTEIELGDAQEMVAMNMAAEVATRAATLHPALNIISHLGQIIPCRLTATARARLIRRPRLIS